MADSSLQEWAQFMRDGDEVTPLRFKNEVQVLADKERNEVLQKTDGPLIEAARRDTQKVIGESNDTLNKKLEECQFPGCKQLVEETTAQLSRFQAAIVNGSWTGMSGFKAERRINLADLLSMKATSRRETEKALARVDSFIQAQRAAMGSPMTAQSAQPAQAAQSAQPAQSGMGKWLIIGAVVIGLLLLIGLAIWYFASASSTAERLGDNSGSYSGFNLLDVNRLKNL